MPGVQLGTQGGWRIEKDCVTSQQKSLRGQNPGDPLIHEVVLMFQAASDDFESFVFGVHWFKIETLATRKNSPRPSPVVCLRKSPAKKCASSPARVTWRSNRRSTQSDHEIDHIGKILFSVVPGASLRR